MLCLSSPWHFASLVVRQGDLFSLLQLLFYLLGNDSSWLPPQHIVTVTLYIPWIWAHPTPSLGLVPKSGDDLFKPHYPVPHACISVPADQVRLICFLVADTNLCCCHRLPLLSAACHFIDYPCCMLPGLTSATVMDYELRLLSTSYCLCSWRHQCDKTSWEGLPYHFHFHTYVLWRAGGSREWFTCAVACVYTSTVME